MISMTLPLIDPDTVVARLKRDGVAWTDAPCMNPEQLQALVRSLIMAPVFNSHVAAKATLPSTDYFSAVSRGWPVFAPHMHDVVRAPGWLEVAMQYAKVAESYYGGRQPYLYSINAFWTLPSEGPLYTETQAWHRDGDDADQFTMFMLGTPIRGPEDGSHSYQRGTHLIPDDRLGWNFRDDPPAPETISEITGPAGTLVIEDTNGLHRASRPMTRPRLLVWARYSTTSRPRSYDWDGLSPLAAAEIGGRYPRDPWYREVIKMVVSS